MDVSPRLAAALGLVILGSTYLWLTPSFAGSPAPAGTSWNATQVLSLVSVLGFCLAAFFLWRGGIPWELLTAVSAIVGLVALAAYWLATRDTPGAANVAPNVVVHLVVSAAALAVSIVPPVHDWLVHWF